jgi:hypothetical protein
MKNILPCVLIVIDLVQAVVCLFQKDVPRAIYWSSAGLLTWSTVIMK